MPVALLNCLAGRPAGKASSWTSAARVGELLVLAGAGDLLQVFPGVAQGSQQQAVVHNLLATSSHGFAFDLVAFRVEPGLFVGRFTQFWLLAPADDSEPNAGGVRDHDDDREREDDGEHPVYRRVNQDLTRVFYARGSQCGHGVVQLAGLYRLGGCGPLGEEADRRVGGEDLLPAGRKRHRRVPREREGSHPSVLQLAHLYEDGRPDCQGNGRQELVRDAEQREELVDASQRIVYSRPEEVAPAGDYEGAGYDVARQPGRAGEGPPDVADEVLDHEPPDTGSRINGGQYEQSLEHYGEVIPERLQGRAEDAGNPGEDRGYPNCERRRAAGPSDYGILADGVGRALECLGAYGEPETVDGLGG